MSRIRILICILIGTAMFWNSPIRAGTGAVASHFQQYPLNSGVFNGKPTGKYVAYRIKVMIPGATSLRLFFGGASLGAGSYILITSLKDSAQQHLDAAAISQWHSTSAYFNGDAVELELIVAPADNDVSFTVDRIFVGGHISPPLPEASTVCLSTDTRTPSSNPAIGRLVDSTYSHLDNWGTVWIAPSGVLVGAAHSFAWGTNTTVEFNVPPSLADGTPQHPNPKDQYVIDFNTLKTPQTPPIQVGNDWAVFSVFPNSETELSPIQEQQAFIGVEQNDSPSGLRITGYGTSSIGTLTRTQQTSTGYALPSSDSVLNYEVYAEPGNSGSPVIDTSTGMAVAIHINGCNASAGTPYQGTSMYCTNLWNLVKPTSHSATVTQLLSDNAIDNNLWRWNGSSFASLSPGDTIHVTTGNPEVLKGDQSKYNNAQKYNNWTVNSGPDYDIINPHKFYYLGTSFTSHLDPIYNATIESYLTDASSTGFPVSFKDPWLIDYNDPTYGMSNRGMSAAPYESVPIATNNLGTGSSHQGVFLNQRYDVPNQPYYYSVAAPATESYNGHTWAFLNWSGTDGTYFQNATADTTPVVFGGDGSTVSANYKGLQLSNDPTAFSNNGQRKIIKTPNGFLHCVYSDGGHIWYEYSTDNGATWHLGMNWLATGPYGPLDGTAGGKDPSIDYDPQTNNVVIVWQQKSSSGYYTIQYMTFWPDDYVQNTYSINSYGTLYTDGSDAYSSVNANPNIAVNATASGGTEFWVLSLEKYHWYITAGDTVFGGIDVLWGTFNGGNSLDISQDNYGGDLPTHIAGTNYASVNATIYGNKTSAGGYNGSNSGWTFPLAWQQNPGINGTQIKYTQLTLYYDANGVLALHQDPVTQLSQSNTPDNHNPSIIAIPGSNGPTYAVCWLLDFTGEGLSTTTRVCYTSGNNTSLNYVGSLPQSCSLNVSDDNSVSYFVWSQGSAPWSDYVVSTSNLGSAIALNSTGDGMQLSNGSGKSNMYEISYLSSGSAPYAISPAIGLGSVGGLQSTAPAHLSDSSRTVAGAPVQAFDSRGVVIGNDSASLQYLFGDITVDGKSVPFVTIPDTFKSRNLSDVNQLLETQPFSLNGNSKVTFGEFSVIADTEAMSTLLGDTGYVSFKAELLNASTDKVLGTIRGWNFGSKDLSKFKQAAYNLNTGGYSGNDLKIRITASTNIEDPIAIPVNDYSTENVAASASAQSVTMQQANLVTTYSLSQNYPNPFNPTTVIEYTIPEESQVTLKIYDVLGQEVETLVNEEENVGKYQVQFNGSRLASGVYFYRLVAGSHVITKKMLMI